MIPNRYSPISRRKEGRVFAFSNRLELVVDCTPETVKPVLCEIVQFQAMNCEPEHVKYTNPFFNTYSSQEERSVA